MTKLLTLTKSLFKWIIVASIIAAVVYQLKFSPVAVRSHDVQRGSITAEVMGTGTLEARVGASISPKISGRIVALSADQGDRVSAGDELVRLDDAELKQQVAIADANVEAARAAITRLTTDRERAVAVFQQARRSESRIQSLLEKNATSRDDADKATEALGIAGAGLTHAEAAIAEGQKELIAAEKTAQYHSARLQDTVIVAPFDGLIVKRSREPGDVVVPGTSILTLISTDQLWISAWVDETEMSKLEPQQTARVVFRSEPDKSYAGQVARLGREADRETREFVVDVRVLELPENWAVGQRAEAFIEVGTSDDALILPANLMLRREGESGVYVDDGGASAWRVVQTGIRSRDAIEIIDGLQENDRVIMPLKSFGSLTEGRRIKLP
ncbi:efflux RND transporter periplasmic adaptor subunit [Rhodopirellula europaea]|uniref:Efflux transporter, RND family, MFP subunit n=1 Tax=Rhodopirellula europaea SH398 TaxID=1263868 RepID=M5RYG1_9BACT|nr:efflux RND transporter periplasmic adaptor subunit [Rhodopirellula europaea]EMI24320.1 efflux transporter, RND family, MFP subunit [Rhodopirellula europaea SH398]MCR9210101.1 efflux RND transporter periplasmic adaptor subunit [bacterium]